MLSLLGFLTIGVILALLLTNRVAAVVALAGVPVVGALLAGYSFSEIGAFVGDGLGSVAGVATMFVFAIVYFGVMRDAGMFDPVIRRIVGWAGNAPVTVCLATTALAIAAHLDGAGATTFLITIPAMLPLFDRLGMRRLALTSCVGLGAGVMNVLPWGGPTARAAATVGVPANELWVPLIPAQAVGVVAALGCAYLIGRREQRRLELAGSRDAEDAELVDAGRVEVAAGGGRRTALGVPAGTGTVTTGETDPSTGQPLSAEDAALRRPRLFWVNVALTAVTMAGLVLGVAAPEMVFLVAVVIALAINYPGLKQQTARIEAHAKGAMLMATTLLAAGAFLGILSGSGMIDAMATSAATAVPDAIAPGLPLLVGILGVPLSLVFGPDAYYFGVLPVLIGVGEQFGVSGVHLAQASLLGEETVGFPISPLTGAFYLLVGLGGVDIGRHIRALFGWAWLVSLVMLAVAFATGVIPLWGG